MFLLLLMGLGAANIKAQVRIGGNTPPNPAAALDLNAAEGTTAGTKGLALPRVTLGSSTATLNGTTANITGMLVYNTSGSLSTGVYYWSGTNWNRVDGAALGGDTIIGNEVTNATTNRGLVLSGTGTRIDPLTLGIAPQGVDSSMLKRLDRNDAILAYTNGNWHTVTYDNIYTVYKETPLNTRRADTIDISTCVAGIYAVVTMDNWPALPPSLATYCCSPYPYWVVFSGSTCMSPWWVQAYCWRVH